MKKFFYFMLGALFFTGFAYAASNYTYQTTLLPLTTNSYDLGTTTDEWRTLYVQNLVTTGTCSGPACGSSSFSTTSANYWASLGLAFSTTSSNYWETQTTFTGASTTLLQSDTNTFSNLARFSGGILATASSTFNGNATTTGMHAFGNVRIPSLGAAAGSFIAVDPNGVIIATTTPSGSNSAFSPAANYATTGTLPSYTYTAGVITAAGVGALSVDGANPSVGQIVLVKNESGACTSSSGGCNNGLYNVTVAGSGIAAFVLTRNSQYNSSSNVIPGIITYVISGTVNSDDFYAMTSAAPITIGTTALTYVEVSGGGASVTSVSNSDNTLTISPTSGAVVSSLNLGHSNLWSVLQSFALASSTLSSVFSKLYVGGTATTTIDSGGNIVIPSTATLTNTGVTNGCANWTSGVLGTTGIACPTSSFAYPFFPFTNFSTTTSATTSPIQALEGIFASSTSNFNVENVYGKLAISTSTTQATPYLSVTNTNPSGFSEANISNGTNALYFSTSGTTYSGNLVSNGINGQQSAIYTLGTLPISFATNNIFAMIISSSTQFVGIASTTPWGLLSVNANAIGTAPQFVVGSSTATNFIVTNAGNVGIGTTTPIAALDTYFNPTAQTGILSEDNSSATTLGANFTNLELSNSNTTVNNYEALDFTDNVGDAKPYTRIAGVNTIHGASGSMDLAIITTNAGVASEKMRLTAAGKLGIGTSTPGQLLTIDSSGTNQLGLALSGTTYAELYANATRTLGISNGNAGTEQFTILSNGSVGIGTTSPSNPLTVSGTNGLLVDDANNNVSGYVQINRPSTSSDAATWYKTASASTNAWLTGLLITGTSASTNYDISYNNGSWQAPALSITTSGAVGIGSTTPFSTLSVGTGIASSSVTVAEYKYGAGTNVATSTAMQADCNASTQLAIPIGTSATTITLVNLVPGKKCIVVVQNPNAVAGAITWAVSSGHILKWAGGTMPTQTTTANTMDVWSFLDTMGSSTQEVIGAATLNN